MRVSRPLLDVVLKLCVTDTNETLLVSKISISLAKSDAERETIDLVDHDDIDPAVGYILEEPLQRRGRSTLPPEKIEVAVASGLKMIGQHA